MQFLTPAMIAAAAALTVPPLLALYFLKLKRKTHPVSSTLLWKKAIEDLHVNAPFQRLRSSLLLLLQLLVLLLGAIALGQPMLARQKEREKSLILMIDQSASMGVYEEAGETRLDIAKDEAKRVVEALDEDTRAMVIALCDRATIISPFDTDKDALGRKIDQIEQTSSTTTLAEAVSLAEAYSQNLIIGTSAGTDVAPESAAPRASVVLLTDGRIADMRDVSPQRIDLSDMEVVLVGERSDNVAVISMDARRNYERPQFLQVFATVQNFGPLTETFDVSLYIDNQLYTVQSTELAPGAADDSTVDRDKALATLPSDHSPPPGSVASIAFDDVEFEGSGVLEIRVETQDALPADNRAWTVIPPARRVDVLLVTEGNFLLEKAFTHLNVNATKMTPDEYENAAGDDINDGKRAKYDVVVFDGHDTDRLPQGNYVFWSAVPKMEGVERLGVVDNEAIVDWDDKHPILRHVSVSSLDIFLRWNRIKLPEQAIHLIEGETLHSNPLSYFSQGGSQFVICNIPLYVADDDGTLLLNTDWPSRWDFVTFLYDTVEFLAASRHAGGVGSLKPGQPQTISVPERTEAVTVTRPDRTTDTIPAGGATSVTYARTRLVGTYEIEPAVGGEGRFAVNLFDENESHVAPSDTVVIGSSPIDTTAGDRLVNEPLWKWALLALLAFLIIEWVIYNKRVFV